MLYWSMVIIISVIMMIFFGIIDQKYMKISHKHKKGSFTEKLYFSARLLFSLIFLYVVLGMDKQFIFDIFCVTVFLGVFLELNMSYKTKNQGYFALTLICFTFAAFIVIPIFVQENNVIEKYFIYSVIAICMDSFMSIFGRFVVAKLPDSFIKMKYPKQISPNKTFLAVVLALIANYLLFTKLLELSVLPLLIISVSVALGDALFSYYKRCVGISDFSRLLGPIGGFCDRFNGWIIAFCAMEIFY